MQNYEVFKCQSSKCVYTNSVRSLFFMTHKDCNKRVSFKKALFLYIQSPGATGAQSLSDQGAPKLDCSLWLLAVIKAQ